MKLSALMHAAIPTITVEVDGNIEGITVDSRAVASGDLFMACQGISSDARQFIPEAIARGAAAVLYEADNLPAGFVSPTHVPAFAVSNLSKQVGHVASAFYQHPSKDLQVVGVTGTNGKTSCSHFIAHALHDAHAPSAVIGTVGQGQLGRMADTQATTPPPIRLHRQLAAFKQEGVRTVSMEVSSHALAQGRTAGVAFDVALFTNLTQDHLDYHKDMDDYASVKASLFSAPGLSKAVFNADDTFGRQLIAHYCDKLTVWAYGINSKPIKGVPMVTAHDIQQDTHGLTATISSPDGQGVLTSPQWGQFNLSNILAMISVLGVMGVPLAQALARAQTLPTVKGRMQRFGGKQGQPLVVVDYAHTPDALDQVCQALRAHHPGKLWCVFGCGGNRDQGKRAIMGRIADRYADHIILTNDNPRFEEPEAIVADIKSGITTSESLDVILDRASAIDTAIKRAGAQDIILIAGKGHEAYQEVKRDKLIFSDIDQIQIALQEQAND